MVTFIFIAGTRSGKEGHILNLKFSPQILSQLCHRLPKMNINLYVGTASRNAKKYSQNVVRYQLQSMYTIF